MFVASQSHRPPKKIAKRFHAAKESRLIGDWNPGGQDQNSLIAHYSPTLRARVRDLVRNFAPFARAVNGVVAFVVGKGSRFQSLAVKPNGEPDLKVRQKIESRFRAWMDKADVTGRLHYYELKQLAVRQSLESGEFLARFLSPKSPYRHPFAIQMLESENFNDDIIFKVGENSCVFQGIEFDIRTGEVLAYHLQANPYSSFIGMHKKGFEQWREPAKNVLHGFKMLRPGQLRGVTPFAPAILCAKDMADYTEAEIDAAKLAAKWLAFITSQDPAGMQGMGNVLGGKKRSERDDIEDFENAVIEYLRTGEKIEFAPNPGRPGDSFDRFSRHVLRFIAIVAPLPYEVLSGDYTNINYSTSKASRNDYSQLLSPYKFSLEQHLDKPTFYRWLDYEALTQDYLPGYFNDPYRYRAAMWIPAGMPSVDPLRDGKANIDAIKSGLKSPQQVILDRGDDPEEVAAYLIYKNWSKITQWFKDLWVGIKTFFKEKIGQFIKFLLDVDVSECGGSIVDSIWLGIKNKWKALTRWLKESVKDLVDWMPDWVKEGFGISEKGAVASAIQQKQDAYRFHSPLEKREQQSLFGTSSTQRVSLGAGDLSSRIMPSSVNTVNREEVKVVLVPPSGWGVDPQNKGSSSSVEVSGAYTGQFLLGY